MPQQFMYEVRPMIVLQLIIFIKKYLSVKIIVSHRRLWVKPSNVWPKDAASDTKFYPSEAKFQTICQDLQEQMNMEYWLLAQAPLQRKKVLITFLQWFYFKYFTHNLLHRHHCIIKGFQLISSKWVCFKYTSHDLWYRYHCKISIAFL